MIPSMSYDVIVIGGGPSGMMAAGRAAERGKRVLLLEKNARVGVKLAMTGGGRCNITNAEMDEHALLAHYGEAKSFLHSAFAQFGVKETFSFFESRGLPLMVEAHGRAFPKTERATDVRDTLEQYMKEGKVEIKTNATVEKIEEENQIITSVSVNGRELRASTFILATGGKSHPETGSTGDGFRWLRTLKHTVHEPTPTVVPIAVRDPWIKSLAGTTLPNSKITLYVNGEKKYTRTGNILCTHFGLSGPVILNSAHLVADLLHEGQVTARIDCYPKETIGSLDARITALFDETKNKSLKNVWNRIAPQSTGPGLLPLIGTISPDKKVHSITKGERRTIVDLLKALPVTIAGLMGYDRAVVSDGGIILEEIDTRTMRSKKYKNLFLTGDLLHITRPSGGYSLQLCWTTGYIAGENA
jgi:predicted Rossmann fold flavoprotein